MANPENEFKIQSLRRKEGRIKSEKFKVKSDASGIAFPLGLDLGLLQFETLQKFPLWSLSRFYISRVGGAAFILKSHNPKNPSPDN